MRGMGARCVRAAFGREVLDLEPARGQAFADESRALLVRLAGRIDRRHADQLRGEGDDFVREVSTLARTRSDRVHGHEAFYQKAGGCQTFGIY